MDILEQLASIVVLNMAVVNDHVVEDAVAGMSGFVGHDFTQLLVLLSHPVDRLASYEASVAILSLVHGVNVQVIVEVAIVEEFGQCLKTTPSSNTSLSPIGDSLGRGNPD